LDTFELRRGEISLKKFELPPVTVRGIIKVRDSLGVSQPVFAKILGVSPQSVKAWEQGSKLPPGTVRRLIDEMKRNPGLLAGAAWVENIVIYIAVAMIQLATGFQNKA